LPVDERGGPPGGGGIGLPVVERGGPPGGGGVALPPGARMGGGPAGGMPGGRPGGGPCGGIPAGRCGGGRRLLGGGRGRLGRLGLLGRGLLRRRLVLLRLHVATEPVAVGLATDAVGLGVLDARGVALGLDAEVLAQVEGLFVGEAELTS
jgi:hypothetical protein